MKKRTIILIHASLWIIYAFNSTVTYPQDYIEKYGMFNIGVKQSSGVLMNMTVFYINYLLLIPGFLSKRKYWMYGISTAGLIGLSYFLIEWRADFLDWYFDAGDFFQKDVSQYMPYYIMRYFFFIVLSIGAKFTADWFKSLKLKEELEREKVKSELAQLRYQINPHFLFNTLNNIYSLVKRKSEKAPAAVLKLSEIMRFIITDTSSDKIPVSKELDYACNFIALQKLRITNPDIIDIKIGEMPGNLLMPPMILIPFVENAFKHGDLNSENAFIKIEIFYEQNVFTASIANLKSNGKKDETHGIGINNVKRRLELLYPGKHELTIIEDDKKYKAIMRIEMT